MGDHNSANNDEDEPELEPYETVLGEMMYLLDQPAEIVEQVCVRMVRGLYSDQVDGTYLFQATEDKLSGGIENMVQVVLPTAHRKEDSPSKNNDNP